MPSRVLGCDFWVKWTVLWMITDTYCLVFTLRLIVTLITIKNFNCTAALIFMLALLRLVLQRWADAWWKAYVGCWQHCKVFTSAAPVTNSLRAAAETCWAFTRWWFTCNFCQSHVCSVLLFCFICVFIMMIVWPGGVMIRPLYLWLKGRGFYPYQVTTLVKLFTHMCLRSPSSINWYWPKGSDDLHLCRCFPTLVAVTYFNPMFSASAISLLYSTCCPGLGDSQHCYTVTVSCCCCQCQNYTDRSHW